jgi:hypothetical protein
MRSNGPSTMRAEWIDLHLRWHGGVNETYRRAGCGVRANARRACHRGPGSGPCPGRLFAV